MVEHRQAVHNMRLIEAVIESKGTFGVTAARLQQITGLTAALIHEALYTLSVKGRARVTYGPEGWWVAG
jgi:hypothetical protein